MVSGFDGFGGFGMGNFMFSAVPIFIGIIFVIVVVMMIFNGAKYVKNATSTRESTFVKIVSKRMDVRHHSNMNEPNSFNSFSSSHTYYYITLEFKNGERKEYLDVKNLYGLIAEGDEGYAAIQGDWIVAFERSIPQQQRSSRY